MFELTYEQIRDKAFIAGMRKVLDHEMTDFNKAYKLGRMGTQVNLHQKEADRVFEKLISSHGTIRKDLQSYEIEDDKLESWKKAVDEFQCHKIKVDRHKIRVGDIEGVPLTPSEVAALEPLLDGLTGTSS